MLAGSQKIYKRRLQVRMRLHQHREPGGARRFLIEAVAADDPPPDCLKYLRCFRKGEFAETVFHSLDRNLRAEQPFSDISQVSETVAAPK